jgi:hypothetical protein
MNKRSRAYPVGMGRAEFGMQKSDFVNASRSALKAPSPESGEVRHTALPDDFDGIRFEIGRMAQYVKDAAHDPVVQRQAAEIQSSYGRMLREYAQMNGAEINASDEKLLKLQAIDDWCREHFVYVNDPPNIEVIQTPQRMVKQTKVPARVIQALIAPFYDAFARVIDSDIVANYVPRSTYIGDCDEAVVGMQGLNICTFPETDLRMNGSGEPPSRFFFQFGGNEGTLHHVWSKTVLGGVDYHADHTEPGYKLGDHSKFEAYEDVEILP